MIRDDGKTGMQPGMASAEGVEAAIDPASRDFYCRMLTALRESGVPFLVGGAYAFERYTGIARHTKDFDVFVRRADYERVLATLAAAGCATEHTFAHWLGKAYCGDDFLDVIFGAGNGVAEVDDEWFAHGVDGEVLGIPVKLCPAEEMLWSKAFVMERERYDGADVAHLLRCSAANLDWPRLLRRFGEHWRILLSHLVLFGFIYPEERTHIPEWVMRELTARLDRELSDPAPTGRLCRGTLLSRAQYLVDVERWGYRDARLPPEGNLTRSEVAEWTAAIATDGER